MKSKNIFYLILGIILVNYSCKSKEEVLKPLPSNPSKLALDTLWRSYIGGYSNNPIINSNKDILMSKVFDNPEGEIFKLFDGNTGKLKWEWHDYFGKEEGFFANRHIIMNDILVLCAQKNTYALNTITGKTVWRNQMTNLFGEPQIYQDNDGYIYQGYIDAVNNYKSHVYRTKYDDGKWEHVCTYEDSTKIFDIMYSTPAAFSVNDKGEKMMVYTMYLASNKDNSKYSAKVFGYNMVTKQYDWIKDYTNKYVEFAVCKMSSANGLIYTFGNYSDNYYLIAINANDGSIAWDRLLPEFGVGIYMYKNTIIPLCNGRNTVSAYDLKTGNLVWQQNFTHEMLANMNFTLGDSKVFKNYLFSTQCDHLLVLNLDNGSIVYFKDIALPNGCLQFGLEINEEKRCFYVQDRMSVVCYKLPDEVKY
jgi:outer membrane protein assembly factor BamB